MNCLENNFQLRNRSKLDLYLMTYDNDNKILLHLFNDGNTLKDLCLMTVTHIQSTFNQNGLLKLDCYILSN